MSRFDLLGAVDSASVPSWVIEDAVASEPVIKPEAKPEAKPAKPVKLKVVGDGESWIAFAATLAGGALGSLLWKDHRVLGLIDGFAVGGNVARLATGEIGVRRAVENLGAHVVATAGSLSLKSHPAIGYLAGAMTANVFLRRGRDGFLDRIDETVLGLANRHLKLLPGGKDVEGEVVE